MNLPLANAPLSRDGIVIDPETLDGRELQPDEIAAMRLKHWRAKQEALLQLRNDRHMRELSKAITNGR